MKSLQICIFLILFVFQSQYLTAQKKYLFSKDYWHKGNVELKSGQQVTGLIKYFMDKNILMVKQEDNTLITLQSFQVLKFRIFDSLTKVERDFITYPSKGLVPKTKFAFFEFIFVGHTSLFSREKVVLSPKRDLTQSKFTNLQQPTFEEDFFVLSSKGKFEKFDNLDRLAYFLEQSKQVLETYIKEQKLNLKKRKDLTLLFDYFNPPLLR